MSDTPPEISFDVAHATTAVDAPLPFEHAVSADTPFPSDGTEPGTFGRFTPAESVSAPALTASTLVGTAALAVIGREVFAWLRTLVSAAVYATLIVTFGFQVARVEGLSMAPTLGNQDRLIVNKFAYLVGSPRPGDIVMMYYPADPDKSFVKRVIAGPGDVVRIEDGIVYVNDVRLADDFVAPSFRSHDDHPPKVVEEGYYYVLGDHRNNSSDSREWGEVPKKYIVGKVQLRWWPVQSARVF